MSRNSLMLLRLSISVPFYAGRGGVFAGDVTIDENHPTLTSVWLHPVGEGNLHAPLQSRMSFVLRNTSGSNPDRCKRRGLE